MVSEDFIPYNRPSIGDEEIEEVIDTLKKGWLTLGPKTLQLEKDIANSIGAKHAVCLNSCTAGLHLSLIALGIGPGDEVLVSPFTFASSANVIVHTGAKPVFVDIEEETFNIDPDKIESAITSRTKAIIVVHYGGHPADLEKIMKIAEEHDLKVIEDAAHAIGSEYHGNKIGSSGNLTSFSFYATKNMTTGEGGAVVTDDDDIAEKIKKLRLHGISKDAWKRYAKEGSFFYDIEFCGWKYNMTDIQASLGIHQLKKLDSFISERKRIAEVFDLGLSKIKGIKIPSRKADVKHAFHLYTILLESFDRDRFLEEMASKNIGLSVHFKPLHLHSYYKDVFGYKKGDFPVAEKIFSKIVSLPLYPGMTPEEIDRVILAIRDILDSGNLCIRSVLLQDSKDIYEWRIHPRAREASRNTKEFSFEEHEDWFKKTISDPEITMYMFMEGGDKVGHIRFNKRLDSAEVSITVNPDHYGKGHGSKIVRLGSQEYLKTHPEVKSLIAVIRKENKASLRVFEKSGYELSKEDSEWAELRLSRR